MDLDSLVRANLFLIGLNGLMLCLIYLILMAYKHLLGIDILFSLFGISIFQ